MLDPINGATRADRWRDVARRYFPDAVFPDDMLAACVDATRSTPDAPVYRRYLLVEHRTDNGQPSAWLSAYDTPDDAGDAWSNGIEPDEQALWDPVALVDLDTGTIYEPSRGVAFAVSLEDHYYRMPMCRTCRMLHEPGPCPDPAAARIDLDSDTEPAGWRDDALRDRTRVVVDAARIAGARDGETLGALLPEARAALAEEIASMAAAAGAAVEYVARVRLAGTLDVICDPRSAIAPTVRQAGTSAYAGRPEQLRALRDLLFEALRCTVTVAVAVTLAGGDIPQTVLDEADHDLADGPHPLLNGPLHAVVDVLAARATTAAMYAWAGDPTGEVHARELRSAFIADLLLPLATLVAALDLNADDWQPITG